MSLINILTDPPQYGGIGVPALVDAAARAETSLGNEVGWMGFHWCGGGFWRRRDA
jgi:hypothetical protein